MFEDSTFESTGRIHTRSRGWMLAASAFNGSILLALVLIPLMYPEALPRIQMAFLMEAPPAPTIPPTPPVRVEHTSPAPTQVVGGQIFAPTVIPHNPYIAERPESLPDINIATMDPNGGPNATDVFRGPGQRTVVREVATKLGLASTWDVEIAALLAEIGLVTLPPALREKVRTKQVLTDNEHQLVERIPEFSARLLGSIPRMEPVAQAVLYHCKNFNGSGFPADGVKGTDIPIGSRIIRIVDSAVRMVRKGMPASDALSAILAGPERYDSTVARSLVGCSSVLRVEPKAVATGMRSLPLAELTPGHVLLANIVTYDGTVVLAAGATLNATQLQRLRNFASLNPIVEPISVDRPADAG